MGREFERLPEVFAKRAQHYYTEMDRVEKGIEAWKRGDLREFGKLVFASGLTIGTTYNVHNFHRKR